MDLNWLLLICLLAYLSSCSSQDYYDTEEEYREHLLRREDQLEHLDYESIEFSREDLDDLFQVLGFVAEIRESTDEAAAEKDLKEALDSMLLAESHSNSSRHLGGKNFSKNMKDWLLLILLKAYVQQRQSSNSIMGSLGSGGMFLKDFRKDCDPTAFAACKFPGYVRCMDTDKLDKQGNPEYKCGCDFLHTQVDPPPGKPPCVKNVMTRCTDGANSYECGDNMECLPDALGLEEDSYCYCKEGFAPAKNSLGILALCRPILKDDEADEEDYDYSEPSAGLTATVQQGLLLLLCAIGFSM